MQYSLVMANSYSQQTHFRGDEQIINENIYIFGSHDSCALKNPTANRLPKDGTNFMTNRRYLLVSLKCSYKFFSRILAIFRRHSAILHELIKKKKKLVDLSFEATIFDEYS